MTTVADAARQIADITGMDADQALTLATTYAAQMGVDVPEGDQAPAVEISDETCTHIVGAAHAAVDPI